MEKSQAYLKEVLKKIKLGTEKSLPMSQGFALNKIIQKYKIPAKKWGYSGSAIAIETKMQKILWRDKGSHLEFLGIVNKGDKKRNILPKKIKRFPCKSKRGIKGSIFASSLQEAKNLAKRQGFKLTK